ncbi:hypothetical protein [Halovivax sp.]|uniref:hypothetical protein n=1 Tax=Halovivax sp. TaxID=1935978 RepID=UPI0025B9B14D|nr:hypothetical protein [Halovivax sp.]
MSVIRRPGYGRRTRRRIVDLRIALSIAAVDAATVGCWFALVVVEPRTAFGAVAGLCVLVFGGLLRTGFVGAALDGEGFIARPARFAAATAYAATWLAWLIVAEAVGGAIGLLVAGLSLAALLSAHFALEFLFVHNGAAPAAESVDALAPAASFVVPATLLAVGATTLLGIVWFVDWTVFSLVLPVGPWSMAVEVRTVVNGFFVLACCSFVGNHRFLSGLPEW